MVALVVMHEYALLGAFAKRLFDSFDQELVRPLALAIVKRYWKAHEKLTAQPWACNLAPSKIWYTHPSLHHDFLDVEGDLLCAVGPWASCSLSFVDWGHFRWSSEIVAVRLIHRAARISQ